MEWKRCLGRLQSVCDDDDDDDDDEKLFLAIAIALLAICANLSKNSSSWTRLIT